MSDGLPANARFGVLLVNLGTPDAPTAPAVRRYLREFLWDKRVVDTPRFIWWWVLHCIILVFRPARVAKLYNAVWMEDGSPLLVIGKRQRQALANALQQRMGYEVSVELAMTYGNPAIAESLQQLAAKGVERVLVLPLYPQYSGTTTAAIYDKVAKVLEQTPNIPELRFVKNYHNEPGYTAALAQSVQAHWAEKGRSEKLLMSFHGIPEKYEEQGDPYPKQCRETAEALAAALGLNADQWLCCFQSRFGPTEWVKPYTDHTLRELAESGTKSIDLICPAFAADCLETLEEIAIQNREIFIEAGGSEYQYIPALNDSEDFVGLLADLVQQHSAGW